jgi:peptidoglycan/LPS O-acetylase OafA/YrhL
MPRKYRRKPDRVPQPWYLRNYGFSDAAEVFMFISGVTCALAYDKARRCEGWSGVIRRSLRRGWDIYAAFLLLTLACAILVYLAGREHLADESRKQSRAGRITNAYLRDPRQGGQPSFRKPSYSALRTFR